MIVGLLRNCGSVAGEMCGGVCMIMTVVSKASGSGRGRKKLCLLREVHMETASSVMNNNRVSIFFRCSD
jgi:hypothetical protein